MNCFMRIQTPSRRFSICPKEIIMEKMNIAAETDLRIPAIRVPVLSAERK